MSITPARLVAPAAARPLAAKAPAPGAPGASRAPQPATKARAQGEGDVIDTSSPEAFQHTVVKWVGYVQDARARAAAAKSRLDAARTAEATQARALEGPMVAAKQALAKVEGPLQAEVDRRMAALGDARAALEAAVHPNNAKADALDAQAANVQRDIEGHEQTIRDLRRSIERLDPGSSYYRYETARINGDINGHQDEIERLGRRRFELIQQANDARAVQRDPNDPIVVAARTRVHDATEAVAAAQAAQRDGVEPYVAKVDETTQAFNRGMAQARAVVADAERGVTLAEGEAKRVEDAMRRVPDEVGFFKRLKWRLFDHFDAKAYFKAQAATAGIS
jgi:hypothetical protein